MARIILPTVQPQVGASPLLGADAVTPMPDATGVQVEQLGKAMTFAGMQGIAAQADIDRARATEVDALEREADRTLLYGPNGHLYKVGKDAIDSLNPLLRELEQQHKSFESMLKNDVQRQMFRNASMARRGAMLSTLQNHRHEQALAYDVGRSQARAKNAVQDAANNWPDAAAFRAHLEVAIRDTNHIGDLAGWAPDDPRRRDAVLQVTTDAHRLVIEQMVNQGQASEASSYLKANSAEIEAQDRERLQDLVKRGTVQDRAARRADELMAPRPLATTPESWADYFQQTERQRAQQALDAIAKVQSDFRDEKIGVEERDQTIENIRAGELQHQRDLVNAGHLALQTAEQWLIKNPNGSVADMPPLLLQEIDARGLRGHVNAFAAGGRDGQRRYSTDVNFLGELRGMPDEFWIKQDPGEFELAHKGRLDAGAMRWALAKIATAKKVATKEQATTTRENLAIELSARNVGVLPNDRKANDAENIAFDRYKLAALNALAAAKAGTTIEEVLKGMEAFEVQGLEGGRFFGLSPKEQQDAAIVAPSGRTVSLKNIVDEQGNSLVEPILQIIKEENVQRRARGEVPLPETLQAVVAKWDERIIEQRQRLVGSLTQALQSRGLNATPYEGPLASPGQFIRVRDAVPLLGLTEDEIAERVGRRGLDARMGTIFGFKVEALARLYAELQRDK